MKRSTLPLVRVPFSAGKQLLAWVQHTVVSIIASISVLVVYAGCRRLARTGTQFTVEGLEHLPATGPVLIVARHFHHLYDGCILLTVVPRRLHLLVALDWAQNSRTRFLMELVCSLAEWPVVLRSERLSNAEAAASIDKAKSSTYSPHEGRRYIRHAITESVRLLRSGQALMIFPEAYPNIDPVFTPKSGQESFLPFRTGVARIVEMAERDGKTNVAVVPAGLHYIPQGKRWQVTLRFGPVLSREEYPSSQAFIEVLEQQVRVLSQEVT